MGLDTDARAMVSRAVGAGDMPSANNITRPGLFFNLGFTAIVMGLAIILSDFLLRVWVYRRAW